MEHGDLAVSSRERLIVVLEGVLALVVQHKGRRHLWSRHEETTGYSVLWHDIALKRLVTISKRWPQYDVEIVTFLGEDLVEQAAEYLTLFRIPYSTLSYQPFDRFTMMLAFSPEVRAVYDSDPDHLDEYGQVGHAVVRGEDF